MTDMKEQLLQVKYYLVFLAMLAGMYLYGGITGWRMFSASPDKWAPKQEKEYHK